MAMPRARWVLSAAAILVIGAGVPSTAQVWGTCAMATGAIAYYRALFEAMVKVQAGR